MRAFPNSKSRNGAGASATRLLRNAKVLEEIERIRVGMETDKALTRSKVRELLRFQNSHLLTRRHREFVWADLIRLIRSPTRFVN